MLVHCSNCEMGYVHESTTLLDIGLGTNCNNGWMFQPSQPLGCTIDGKSTGSWATRGRRRDSARRPDGTEARAVIKAFTVANAIVRRAASWSALWYLLSAFAVISYTGNSIYAMSPRAIARINVPVEPTKTSASQTIAARS